MRRFVFLIVLALMVAGFAGCHKSKVQNPLADVGSKQPDKVLFDRAMDLMKKSRWDQARLVLQTLINTYPDSEFIARAKLGVAESWYNEGGSTALAQAENEYRDFQTFFPNMVEASEAQMRIADIHYRQMEKPDRDFTHAKRAEEEYRTMMTQYPDSPLVPEAKARLREVQEVLAEREFLIGRFYYLRESLIAAQARLQTVVDNYPLYSNADESLYMLGQIHERQAENLRAIKLTDKFTEVRKGELIQSYLEKAAGDYSRLITRYPTTERAGDAKARLEAMGKPVPTPTAEAIAQNKAEEASREELGRFGRMTQLLHKAPDISHASKVGEPTLVDPKEASAPVLLRETSETLLRAMAGGAPVPKANPSAPQPKDSANPAPATNAQPDAPPPGIGELKTIPDSDAAPKTQVEVQPGGKATPGANQPPPSNEPPPAPPQVNEAAGAQQSAASDAKPGAKASEKNNDKESSSSKSKKKKGLKKLIPF